LSFATFLPAAHDDFSISQFQTLIGSGASLAKMRFAGEWLV
jgi:hypothetical protein